MPWYAPWSNVIKKKVCRFLLQRYLGQFLEEKLSLDQLNVDFYNGTGTVYDVTLYCQALNDLCEGQGWGIEVICGHIGAVTVNIPYEAPLAKDSSIEVTDLSISLRPKARVTDGTSMFESMWSSMSSSMQLAQECLEREGGCAESPTAVPTNTIEGLEKFAQIIDNVLNRIKARLVNTEIRLEYLPPDSDCGVALIVKVKSIDYQNEAGNDPPDRQTDPTSEEGSQHEQRAKQKSFLISTHATHHISMEGITFYTEEFRIHNPRQQRQQQQRPESCNDNRNSVIAAEQFLSTISDLPDPVAAAAGGGNEFFSYTSACDSSSSYIYKRSDSKGSTGGAPSEEEDDDVDSDYVECIRSGEILAGKVTSKQEIRIKMKQADNLSGPNVELEMSLGCFQLFLSPRQLHSIVLLSDTMLGLNEIPCPTKCSPPDLTPKEQRYEETEFDLKHNLNRMSGGIGLNQGWSLADPMQDMIKEQAEFLDSHFQDDGGVSEMIESSNSSMTSSFTSSSMASRTTSASRRRMIDPDADADISKFNVRVAAIALVLLHEDLLVESSKSANESPLSNASVQKLQAKSERFFRSVGNLGLGLGANDILNAGLIMDSGCDSSHLRFMLAPIIVEGDEQRNRLGSLLRFSVSIARADLREVLTDISVPLLEFYREKNSSALPKRPEISVRFKQTSNAIKGSSGKRFTAPRTEIRFSLAPFLTEFDITILDRLSSLIYQFPFASYYNQATPVNSPASPTNPGNNRKMELKTELYLDSPAIDFRLRFPIPDLRPIHDPQRVPWWRRNVRSDFILIKLQQVRATINLNPHPLYDISANEIQLFYHESEMKSESVHIAKAVMTDNIGSKYSPNNGGRKSEPTQTTGVEYPRILIEMPSEAAIQKQQETTDQCKSGHQNRTMNYEESDSDPTSSESFGVKTGRSKEDTPFSAKRVCRESDTPHMKASADDPETLTLPGDSEELDAFCTAAMKLSKLQIRIDLPVVSLQLKSKHLYEVIYNRISTDLLLWAPSAPAATAAAETSANLSASRAAFQEPQINLANMGMMDSIYAPFTMCQSAIQLDSSSSATNSESESDSDGIFYSVYDRSCRRLPGDVSGTGAGNDQRKFHHSTQHHGGSRRHQQQHRKASFVDRSNVVAFQLNIGQGMLTMFAPVRDAQNHVIPGQLGEFIMKIQSTYVFSVSGFHGNTNLGYLCIQGKAADVYHCGLIPTPASNPPLRLVNSVLPAYILSTLYPTPKNLTVNEQRGCPNREMFSLAIQIKALPEQSIKRIRMAAGIQLTTLRHHSTLPQHSWLTQLLDMFDVVDYPVQGYTPLGVITEMHLHLWDCAIDYRPLYFPYRAVITIGSFMISSNITTESSGLTLRFIAEDAALCLAPQTALLPNTGNEKETQRKSSSASTREDNKVTVLPSSELICLVELGLFEISLRLNEKATGSFPKFDLRTAINDVHVRTCADSGRALAQMIGYLAAEGDLLPQDDGASDIGDNESVSGLPMGNELEGDLVPVKAAQAPEVTPKQQQRVNSLMAEAMEESLSLQSTNSDLSRDDQLLADGEGVEVFFFPDEDQTRAAARKKLINNLVSDNSNKRRFASDDDSLSIEESSSIPSSYQDDDHYLKQRPFDEQSEDTASVNTELRELLNFECSVMGLQKEHDDDEEVVEALPQVTMDLGDVNKFGGSSMKLESKIENSPQRKVSSDTDEDFCFIADEEKPHYGNQEVPVLEDPIRIIDNHFSVPMGKPDLLLAPKGFPMAVTRYTICEMTVTWHIYGGHDFLTEEDRRKPKAKKSHSEHSFAHLPMSEAYKSGVSYSKGSPSVTFGPISGHKHSWKSRGGPERRHDIMMEVQISKVKFSHEVYPPNAEQASRQVLLITELEILDRLAISDIKKFLYQSSVHRPHKGNNHMIVIKALHLRPNPVLPAQECCLRISILPIRLNIDQDSLLFMVNFFNQLGGGDDMTDPAMQYQHNTPNRASQSTPSHPPVMMVELPEAAQELHARKMVSENLMLLIEEEEKNKEHQESTSEMGDESPPIYFRNVIFGPDVPIRIDYHGKRVELSRGPLAGLLMGLGQLQCSEIRLKQISYRHGLLGVDRLISFLLQEWLQDIKKKQLPKILGGVGPMYSLVQLFQGIWDLFWLPIEQYQKDGRIVRGLQRGAQSFTARTALAALEITTRIIHLLQITAETAYDMVSPGPSVRRGRGNKKGKRKRLHPPQDIREGMTNAIQIVRDGISETAHNLVELTALEHDQKGYTGAVGAVMRQIPPMVMQPIVLATQATSNVLGGVKNQLVPDARAEAREKYKDDVE